MTVFTHHIYEYKKGLRNLVLHTMPAEKLVFVRRKLERSGIDHEIYRLERGNVNVFFGARECVEVVRAIGKPCLNDYTPEEDFILGTMLGYDRLLQCRRYLRLAEGIDHSTAPPRGRSGSDAAAGEAAPEAELTCGCGGATCTGCVTGNPCAACQDKSTFEMTGVKCE